MIRKPRADRAMDYIVTGFAVATLILCVLTLCAVIGVK